jgi:hypothetical protein
LRLYCSSSWIHTPSFRCRSYILAHSHTRSLQCHKRLPGNSDSTRLGLCSPAATRALRLRWFHRRLRSSDKGRSNRTHRSRRLGVQHRRGLCRSRRIRLWKSRAGRRYRLSGCRFVSSSCLLRMQVWSRARRGWSIWGTCLLLLQFASGLQLQGRIKQTHRSKFRSNFPNLRWARSSRAVSSTPELCLAPKRNEIMRIQGSSTTRRPASIQHNLIGWVGKMNSTVIFALLRSGRLRIVSLTVV